VPSYRTLPACRACFVGNLRGHARALGHSGRLPEAGGRGGGGSDSRVRALSTAAIYLLSLLRIRKRSNSEIRLSLGRYLVLGLEFQLGADILGTAVAPTFAEVELLAAIVVIRTVLNYFLSKEIERERQEVESTKRGEAPTELEYRAGRG
jgi:uncharacterized membrane protein